MRKMQEHRSMDLTLCHGIKDDSGVWMIPSY